MKTDPETQARIQAETIAAISARCDGPNQFENFDNAFRHSLMLSKDAVVKEEAQVEKTAGSEAGQEADLVISFRDPKTIHPLEI